MYKLLLILMLLPFSVFAQTPAKDLVTLDLTTHWVGFTALGLFVMAYILVVVEEFTKFKKSKPVILVAGIIWALIGWVYAAHGLSEAVHHAVKFNLLEYAELFLFLLVAMTYIESMRERLVFDKLKAWLASKHFTFRQLFWMTGFLSFFMSPVADNLTTALIMGTVVISVGSKSPKFIAIACINIVVASNAGGAFSPFGDITTLMVWQKGLVEFSEFFQLFIPALVSFLVPATIMSFAIKNQKVSVDDDKPVKIRTGGLVIIGLFVLTIVTVVVFNSWFALPPAMGMMTGLSYLMIASYLIQHKPSSRNNPADEDFDFFRKVASAEWDTLLFFFGVIVAVGGIGFMGYLALMSEFMYTGMGATNANILVGVMSALIDNIPVMFAVLTMSPNMPLEQWLLVTLTAGIGGSMLSVGSAAGVALMGQSKGLYTFMSHLKWTPVIALGYGSGIAMHLFLNHP